MGQVHGVRFASGQQSFEGELAHRLQETEAHLAAARLVVDAEQQVALHERGEHVEGMWRRADCLGGFERAATEEDRQAREGHLLVGREERVTPGDRLAQGPVALGDVAHGRLQVEPALQPGQEHCRGQEARSRRRQLDRQWQTIESNAQLGDGARVVRGEAEGRAHGTRALHEQRDRGVVGQGVNVSRAGQIAARRQRRLGQWRNREFPLGAQPQGLATGSQDPQPAAGVQKRADVRGGREQMLAVVEHEQQVALAQRPGQAEER
jgi:hypothetical protein